MIQPIQNFATSTTIASRSRDTFARHVGVIGLEEVLLEMFQLGEDVGETKEIAKVETQNLLADRDLNR